MSWPCSLNRGSSLARDMTNVLELSAGKFDAVRTLRDALAEAERGDIDHVLIIMADNADDAPSRPGMIWCTWSELTRVDVLWLTRWLNAKINHRYFSKYFDDDD